MNYRTRFRPLVARDLDAIAHWLLDYVGPDTAARRLDEIDAAFAMLKAIPHYITRWTFTLHRPRRHG